MTVHKRNSLIAMLIILGCVAAAGLLVVRSLRQSGAMASPDRMSGPGADAIRTDMRDQSIGHYRGLVSAVDSTGGTITITTRDDVNMTFSVPSSTRIAVKRQTAAIGDIKAGYRAMVLSKDGKTALDILSGPRRPRGQGGFGGGPAGGGYGGGGRYGGGTSAGQPPMSAPQPGVNGQSQGDAGGDN